MALDVYPEEQLVRWGNIFLTPTLALLYWGGLICKVDGDGKSSSLESESSS